ncbi:MAG: hypothetical protein ACREU2_02890 [Steroidobacteraceae bacterium]
MCVLQSLNARSTAAATVTAPPASGLFASCVHGLQTIFFAIDNPVE